MDANYCPSVTRSSDAPSSVSGGVRCASDPSAAGLQAVFRFILVVLGTALAASAPSCRSRTGALSLAVTAAALLLAPPFALDAQAQTVQFGAATYTATEDGTAASVEVTLSTTPTAVVTILLTTTNGTGTVDADYTVVPASLTFGTTDMSKSFTVTATSDTKDEDDKSVVLGFGAPLPTGVTAGSQSTTTVNLVDDDAAPTLSVNDADANEGDGVVFTVTLSAESEKEVTVTYTASVESGDTAESGDLSGTLSGSLTFSPGDTSKTLTVSTTEDTTDEDDETFTVTLSSPSNATVNDSTGKGTIIDDDAAPMLSVDDANAEEGDGVEFTVTLSAASEKTVKVDYAASVETGDTAESSDFTAVSATTLTFSAGDTTKTFTVSTDEDTTDEDDETFTVTLTLPSGANATLDDSTGKGTINDDDAAPMLSVDDANAEEGDGGRVHGDALGGEREDGEGRLRGIGGDRRHGGVERLHCGVGDDADLLGGGHHQDVHGEHGRGHHRRGRRDVHGDADAAVGGQCDARRLDRQGHDRRRRCADAECRDANAEEGDGVEFTVTLSAASEKTVKVDYAASVETGDTAESSDFTAVSATTLTFSAGDTTKTFTVSTDEDTTDEDDETFTVTLTLPSGANATLDDSTGKGTINDDDAAPMLSVDDADEEEGDGVEFTVTLSAASEKTVTVTYTASLASGDTAESSDFTAVSATTLTFSAGDTTKTFTVSTDEDTTDEDDETFTVTLTLPSGANATLDDSTGKGTINDDDAAPMLSVDDADEEEGDGVEFTVTLSAASEKTVTVTYTASLASGDTAESSDFTAVSATTLTFSAGDTTKTFTVSTDEDTTDEDDETFTVTLTLPSGANATLDDSTGKGTINDDDAAPMLSVDDADEEEGDGVEFTVTLSAASEKTVTVTYTASLASGDTAESSDFTAVSATTLTFSAGDTTKTFTVSTDEDTTDEDDETFTVTLTLPSGANATLDDSTGKGTINDDDAAPMLSVDDADEEEGDGVEFTVTLSAASEKTVKVDYAASVETGDTTVSGDLSGALSGSLTFSAGDTSKTFTVSTDEDTTDERNETFTVTLTLPSDANATLDDSTGEGTINDDDETPTVTLTLSRTSTSEDDDTAVTVMGGLNHPSSEETRVMVSATAVSPATADDFELTANRTLTIAAGTMSSTGIVSLTPVDNETDAPNKEVTVSATATNDLAVNAPADLTLAISDDDPAPVVTLVLTPTSIRESDEPGTPGNPHVSMVTATLDRPSSEATTVTVSAAAVPPAVAEDFTLSTNKTLTIAAGAQESTGAVTITAEDNNVDAPNKEVTVSAEAENTQGVAGDPANVTLTIEDEEPPPQVTLVLTETSIRESDDPDTPGDQHVTNVTATLEHPSSEQTTITLTASPGDFTLSASGTLTIPAEDTESSAPVTLTAVDDDVDAPDKMLTLNATASNTQGVEQPDGVILTIVDEEPAPTVTLIPSDTSIGENADEATVTAELSHPSSEQTTVTLSADAVIPAVAGDFALAGSVLAIPAGDTGSTGPATLTAVDNETDAPNKEVTVSATAENSQGVAGNPESLTLTIEDDEPAPAVTLILSRNPIPEAGGETTVTTELSHPSSEQTTVTVSADAVNPALPADFSLVGSTLRIAAGRTDSTGTVTLTADDNYVDAADKEVTVSAAVENTQGYASGSPADVALTIADDEERGFVWVPAELTVREVSLDTFRVALTSEPTADVTVTVTSPSRSVQLAVGEGQGVVGQFGSEHTLTFTPANWSNPQGMSVLTTDDGNVQLRHSAAGGDYDGHSDDYAVTVLDIGKETEGVVLTVDRTEIAESAGVTPVTVTASLDGAVLQAATAVSVTVGPDTASTDDFTASPPAFTLTIPEGEGSAERTIGLTPTNDGIDEDDETVSVSGTAADLAVTAAEVTILDDDTRGVTVSTPAMTVDENGSRGYTVVLDSAPSSDVTVTVSVSSDADVSADPEVLTFTTSNWNEAQTVTVSAADDDDPADDRATVSHVVAGADYGANDVTAAPVLVTVDDDDGRGVRVSARDLTVPEGENAPYKVVLNKLPTGDVTVTPRVSGDPDVTVQPGSLTFTTENWGDEQTVTVSAAQDVDPVDDRAAVSHAVVGADYGANNITAPEVFVTVRDDGVTIGMATLSVSPDTVAEGGGVQSVRVGAEIDGPARATDTEITVLVRGGTTSVADFEANPAAFTLTIPANRTSWFGRFDLRPDNDAIDEGDGETVTVSATAADLELTPAELTITDDDERGVTVTPTALTVPEGGSGSYEVVLTSQPTAAVTVRVTSDNQDVTAEPALLTFEPGQWDVAQVVAVRVADDATVEEGATVELAHTVDGGDYGSNEVTVEPVRVTVTARSVTLSVSPDRVAEGVSGVARTVTVTATLDGVPRTGETVVTVSVSGGTASEGGDFEAVGDFAITISAAETSAEESFTLAPVDDAVDEPDETVVVTGAAPGVTVTPAAGLEVTITDDDERGVTVTPTVLTVPEGGSGSYEVVLTSQPTAAVTVTVTSAAAGAPEVTVGPETLTFTTGNWNEEQTVTVSAARDLDADDGEATVTHAAAGGDYDGVTGAEVAVTVRDDGVESEEVRLSVSPDTVDENGGARTVTVTAMLDAATRATATEVTVTVEGGTAEEGDDFEPVNDLTVTITAGATSGEETFTLAPVDDEVDEPDETVVVTGAAPGVTVTPAAGLEVTITDDDERGVTVTPTVLTVPEGGSGSYEVVLTSQPTAAVTVTVTSAAAGAPEVTVGPETLTFTTGNWNEEQTVTVSAARDLDADDGEATVTHAAAGGDYDGVTGAEVAVTVRDDGVESEEVRLSVSPDTVDENGGARTVTVTAMLDAATRATATEVTVTVEGGTAEEGDDFEPVNDLTVTITAGATSGEETFTLAPVDDEVDEPDETVVVTGAAPGVTVTPAAGFEVTITDDDATPVVALSLTPGSIREDGGESTVTATLDHASSERTTVTVSTEPVPPAQDGDFTQRGTTLTILAGATRSTGTVTIGAVDNGQQTGGRRITVSGVGENVLGVTGPTDDLTLTITDDETLSSTVILTVSPDRVAEGASGVARTVTVTATLDGAPRTGETVVAVSVSGGTASEGDDFEAVGDFAITIPAAETSAEESFTLAPVDDAVDEPDETVVVTGAAPGVTVTPAAGLEVTITDDDERGVTVTPTALTVPEGGSGSYEVVLTSQPTAAVTVTPAAAGAPEVTVGPETLTFTTGNWNEEQTVTVSAARDLDADDGEATVTHAAAGGDYDGVTGAEVAVTVRDDGVESEEVRLSVSPDTVDENGGARTVTVTAMLDAATRATATEVTVTVEGGTAEEGDDFEPVNDLTVTITAGATSGEETFTLAPVDDEVDEPDETVVVTGAAPGVTVTPAAGLEVTITDDDERGVTVTPTALTVPEGGSGSYEVVLTSQPTAAVTVTPAAAGAPEVTVGPETLTFTTGNWNEEQTVTVSAARDLDADDGEATVTHAAAGGDYDGVTGAEVAVTVRDDGVESEEVRLSVSPDTVDENGGARTVTVTAMLDAATRATATEVTVTVEGGTAEEGDDFEPVNDLTVTITAGATSGEETFTLAPVDDEVDEPDETVVVTGAAPGVTVTPAAGLEVTITDDDERGVTVTPTALTVPEGGSGSYEVVLTSQPTAAVTVRVTSDNQNVTAEPALLTFEPGQWDVAQVVAVRVADDATVEEGATVELAHTVDGGDYGSNEVTVEPVRVTVTARSVTLSVSPDRVAEGVSGVARTVTVTATLDGVPRTGETVVTVSVSGGTASEGGDFEAVGDFAITISAGETSAEESFTLAPVDDAVDEPDETVVVTGAAPGVTVTPAAGLEVTITDDDERGVTVTPTALTVPEGGSGSYEVVLTSQPTAAVTVRVTSENQDVTAEPALLTFEPDQWNMAQGVTVRVADDDIVEDDAAVELTHTVDGGDYGSNGVTADPVAVTVPGIEVEGMTVTFRIPATGEVTVPEGTPVPSGIRLTLPGGLAGNTVAIRAVEDDPALGNPPRGFSSGDPVVDIALGAGIALAAGQTATVCLPVADGGRGGGCTATTSPPALRNGSTWRSRQAVRPRAWRVA